MSESNRQQTARSAILTRVVVWAWLGYWVLLFAVMHMRRPPGARLVYPFGDKVLHTATYLILGLLGGWAALRRGRRIDAGWVIRWALVYAAYAAADELLQPLVHRTCQFGDWLADVAGIAAALALIWWLGSRRSRKGASLDRRPPPPEAAG